jgi:hydrogenase-4 membrane subunit HyfE
VLVTYEPAKKRPTTVTMDKPSPSAALLAGGMATALLATIVFVIGLNNESTPLVILGLLVSVVGGLAVIVGVYRAASAIDALVNERYEKHRFRA